MSRRFGSGAAAALLCSVLLAAGLALPDHAAGQPDRAAEMGRSRVAPPLRRAALRVVVHTSSDWVEVTLPGVSAGHVRVDRGGGHRIHPTRRGFVVRGRAGRRGTATVDVVTEVPRGFREGSIRVRQGAAGSTVVSVHNRTAELVEVTSVRTSPGDTGAGLRVSRRRLLAGRQLEWIRADPHRRVLAFTYPWFDDVSTITDVLSTRPTGLTNFNLFNDALSMAVTAREHGIDGFVMSFSGGASHGLALHQALRAAEQTGGTATILLETAEAEAADGATADVVAQWLREALRQSARPAFLRLRGVPVVFAFEAERVPAAGWRAIAAQLANEGTPVRIIGDFWAGRGQPIAGQYRYNALLDTPTDPMTPTELTGFNRAIGRGLRARATLGAGEPGLVVATAQPGWDDRALRGEDRAVVGRKDGATYDATWRAALAAEADWVVITSWNEWYEGTSVAPSVEHDTTALEATAAWAARFAAS